MTRSARFGIADTVSTSAWSGLAATASCIAAKSDARSALGSISPATPGRPECADVVGVPRGIQAVHPHDEARLRQARERIMDRVACRGLAVGQHRVFEIDHRHVRAGRTGLVETLGAIAGSEQDAAGGSSHGPSHPVGRVPSVARRLPPGHPYSGRSSIER